MSLTPEEDLTARGCATSWLKGKREFGTADDVMEDLLWDFVDLGWGVWAS
jgi:hypothetical protein